VTYRKLVISFAELRYRRKNAYRDMRLRWRRLQLEQSELLPGACRLPAAGGNAFRANQG
jgi:hypothetical protein